LYSPTPLANPMALTQNEGHLRHNQLLHMKVLVFHQWHKRKKEIQIHAKNIKKTINMELCYAYN
jgi:hypothetical protein